MQILQDLIESLPGGDILDVRVGSHWTAVVAKTRLKNRQCGLASTLGKENSQPGESLHIDTDKMMGIPGIELANLVRGDDPIQRSIGMAAINALIPLDPGLWHDGNAEQIIEQHGNEKSVAIVGRFPFVERVRSKVGSCFVLEQAPLPGEISSDRASDILPKADVVAITGMTLINHTLDNLLTYCRSDAKILLLGPSTPLSDILFQYKIHFLSGSVVENVDAVLDGVMKGLNFRQLHHLGVRLVTMSC